jgi:hypothetical protein
MLPETKFLSQYFGLTGAKIFLGVTFIGCFALLVGAIIVVGSLLQLL